MKSRSFAILRRGTVLMRGMIECVAGTLRFALKGRILRQVCTAESHGPVLPTLGLAGEGSGAGTRAKPLAGRILQPPQQDGSVACLKSSYVESHAPFVPCHAAAGAQNCSRKVPGRQPILEVSSIA